jgi:Cu(I)/Ag(I) efflux system protein CusF
VNRFDTLDPTGDHMKTILSLTLVSFLAFTGPAVAADAASAPASNGSATPASSDMTDGEVRKVDMDNKKITLRHAEIKNLGMPGMTMVFQVKDPAFLDKVKTGDKVRFTAEKMNGALTVTNIEPAD